jgi:arabinogalactan oligomer/maltooligosaccharide transport system substrate-binding protein
MQRLMSRLPLLLLVAAVALVAAAVAAGSTAQKQVTTITFWNQMNAQEVVTAKTLVSQFEASHPDIKVDMTVIPFTGYVQKFSTAAQAGQAPDVIRTDNAPDTQGLAAQGLLTDLSSQVTAAERADFVQAALKGGIYNGKLYSIPQTVDALGLYYNKALFKAKGIKTPPATLAQLVTTCQKFGNGKGILLNADSYWIQPWIWGYGGGLVDMQKKQILVASKKSIAGWTAFNSLFQNKCAFPNKDFSNSYTNMQTAFKNGQVAMIVNGPWASSDLLTGPSFKSSSNLGVAVIPPGPGGQGSPIGGGALAISRNSKSVDAAYTFVKWFTSPAQQAVIAAQNNDLPTHISAYKLPAVKQNRILVDFLAQLKKATDRSAGAYGGQLYTDFTPAVQSMLSGKSTPAKAAAATAAAWKSKLFPSFTVVK